MRVIDRLGTVLRDLIGHRAAGRGAPACEGRVLYLVDDNPGGEVVRVAPMGRLVVKVLDRAAFDRACATAMAGRGPG